MLLLVYQCCHLFYERIFTNYFFMKMVRRYGKRSQPEDGFPKAKNAVNRNENLKNFGGFHEFSDAAKTLIRTNLLKWYDENKRSLPWRNQISTEDVNQKAYAVWVSEIMLQQTQVATVIDYYNRWMTKWPTLQELAKAKLEEVNEMWSGLGYYSRGKRLHEGAKKVVNELEGQVPKSAADLEKKLPGVGRYTAGAIASIALGEKTGVVDGNVIRVFSRLRMIGADVSSPATMDKFWELANELADCERTGDLNQGLMELGAMVCTPKSPKCSSCPLQETCRAFAKVTLEKKQAAGRLMSRESDQCGLLDIECLADACQWCLPSDEPWDKSLGVQNLPRKAKKKAPREQMAAVTVVCKLGKDSQQQFLLMKRPEKGLLAGLWEFPNFEVKGETEISSNSEGILQRLKNNHSVEVASAENVKTVGDVLHLFSHIHQTYCVTLVSVTEQNIKVTSQRPWQWLTSTEVNEAAIPTAMKKVFSACMKVLEGRNDVQGKKRKRNETGQSDAKQRSIDSFFKCK